MPTTCFNNKGRKHNDNRGWREAQQWDNAQETSYDVSWAFSKFLFFFFLFLITYFFLDDPLIPDIYRLFDNEGRKHDDGGNERRSRERTPKRRRTTSLGHLVSSFFSFSFPFLLLTFFLDDPLVPNIYHLFDNKGQKHDDNRGRWGEREAQQRENAQETSYDVSWAFSKFLFFFSFFITYLFFRWPTRSQHLPPVRQWRPKAQRRWGGTRGAAERTPKRCQTMSLGRSQGRGARDAFASQAPSMFF